MNKENGSGRPAGVYLGPSFYGTVQKGTVMAGQYPPKFQALLEEYPFLCGLIVPVGELAEKRKELKKSGTEMDMLYQKALEVKEGRHV